MFIILSPSSTTPQNTLVHFWNPLVRQQKEIIKELQAIDKEEEFLAQNPFMSFELGTNSWESDVRSTKMIIKDRLLSRLKTINQTMLRVRKGIYGKCERCDKQIEEVRLRIIPTATLCIRCK